MVKQTMKKTVNQLNKEIIALENKLLNLKKERDKLNKMEPFCSMDDRGDSTVYAAGFSNGATSYTIGIEKGSAPWKEKEFKEAYNKEFEAINLGHNSVKRLIANLQKWLKETGQE